MHCHHTKVVQNWFEEHSRFLANGVATTLAQYESTLTFVEQGLRFVRTQDPGAYKYQETVGMPPKVF